MTHKGFALSCPGNLLLTGEYAVLEEGGLGICLAPDLRAWLMAVPMALEPDQGAVLAPGGPAATLPAATPATGPGSDQADKPAINLAILVRQHPAAEPALFWSGRLAGNTWQPSQPPLLAAILDKLSPGPVLPGSPGHWTVLLDTSSFHDQAGNKLGLGSSAAATLLLTAFFHVLSAPDPRATVQDPTLCHQAVAAHRQFQGGKGSGYDIWTSFLGGVSLFSGGACPSGQPMDRLARLLPPFRLLQGAAPQKTTSAIAAYQAYKQKDPAAAATWLANCKRLAQGLAAATDQAGLFDLLDQARTAGQAWGRLIGCPADFPRPPGLPPDSLCKATGAGNENAILLGPGLDGPLVPGPGLTLHPVHYGQARGKLTLFGEHAALQGYPACGTGLPQSLVAVAVQGSGLRATPSPPAADVGPAGAAGWDLDHVAPVLRPLWPRVLELAAPGMPSLPPGQVRLLFLLSAVPRAGGYGSSAALSLGLVRLFACLAGQPLKAAAEWLQANRLDCLFHGQASGMDTGLAQGQGLCLLEPLADPAPGPGGPEQPLPPDSPRFSKHPLPPAGIWLVHAAIQRQGNTRSLVQDIRTGLVSDTPAGQGIRQAMAGLGRSCSQAARLLAAAAVDPPGPPTRPVANPESQLRADKAHQLGQLASEAQQHLGRLGLVADGCQAYLDLATTLGSLGGKMSGAGGGGAFYCVCRDQESAGQVARAWAQAAGQSGRPPLAAAPRVLAI